MKFPQKPNHAHNIIQTLVVGDKNNWDAFRDAFSIFDFKSRSQQVADTHEDKIEVIDTFFMSLITKYIEANPLDRMEKNQGQKKKQQGNKRDGIRYYFFHFVNHWHKNKKYIFGG